MKSFDSALKQCLELITNTKLSEQAWIQTSLPVNQGGLGIRHAVDLSLPAFLSSIASVSSLVSLIWSPADLDIADAHNKWRLAAQCEIPEVNLQPQQHNWEKPITLIKAQRLVHLATSEKETARILGVSSKGSGEWLKTLPATSLGTLLDDESFRICVSLRLGTLTCCPHVCPCGATVDESGTHGLSCRLSAGRRSRHSAVNDLIHRALVSAGIPSILEPQGTSRDDGKRPDGMTLVPWTCGKPLVWDFTCVDSLATSRLGKRIISPGWAATDAEKRKRLKYTKLDGRFVFSAVGIETLGGWGSEALSLINTIGRRMTLMSGDPRATTFLKQKISLAIQRGNAASILATLPRSCGLKELMKLP